MAIDKLSTSLLFISMFSGCVRIFQISRIVVTTMIDIIWDDIIWDDDGLDEAVLAILLLIEEEEETHRLEDDEMEEIKADEPHVWGEGLQTGKAGNIERRRVFYSHLLHDDFWGAAPVYDEMHFKRFFRLPKGLFDQIVVDLLVEYDDYFWQKSDAAGKLGFTPVQKIASSVRLLTSGVSSSDQDDKYRLSATTGLESMKRFCQGVNNVYSASALFILLLMTSIVYCSEVNFTLTRWMVDANRSMAIDMLKSLLTRTSSQPPSRYNRNQRQVMPCVNSSMNRTGQRSSLKHHVTEPYRPNHKIAEGLIREIRTNWFRVMIRKNVPSRL